MSTAYSSITALRSKPAKAGYYTCRGIPERSDGRFSIEECAEAFGYYTALNPRVRKPVVHFSLNPSPEDRLSEAQLTQLAAEFMERMGYGRQPYVVFLHEDIARRHMHVVSVRVDEQGRKIDHNNELRRAMAVCRALEHEYGLHVPEDGGVQTEPEELHRVDYLRSDLKHQLRNVVMTLKQQYGFQSLAEFNTLLERYGVAAEEIRGDVRGRPYRGLVYHVLDDDGQRTGAAVKASRLGDFFGWKALEEKFDASKQRLRQHPETLDRTRREIDHARSGSRNREEFTAELRENGIDAVFRENDAGRIYGVTFIDRTTHQVFNGSRLGKEYAANAFEAWFNGREQESSTPMPEELRPLPPLEPPLPGLSSVEEFEEYIDTHYVSMPDVIGELMEYTPEKEWETAPEYRLFPRRKKRRRKNPEKNLTTSIRYDHARRRRSARLGQSRGFHAGDQLSVSRHSHLLVLLRVVCADGMNDFRRRPHPAKFPADGCLVLIAALHQTLLHGISRIVVHGKPWREGRENIVEAYRRGRRHRHTAILRKRLAARDECRYDPAGGALYGNAAGGIPRNAGGRAMEQPFAKKPYDG